LIDPAFAGRLTALPVGRQGAKLPAKEKSRQAYQRQINCQRLKDLLTLLASRQSA